MPVETRDAINDMRKGTGERDDLGFMMKLQMGRLRRLHPKSRHTQLQHHLRIRAKSTAAQTTRPRSSLQNLPLTHHLAGEARWGSFELPAWSLRGPVPSMTLVTKPPFPVSREG